MSPKISVIIPVYNLESLISICLDSILRQTISDIEIICIDDQSSDSSLSIIRSYAAKESRIKVITQENKGPGGARNRGLDEATGEFILFVDGDDYIEEEYCEKIYQAAVKHQADIVVVGIKKIYSTHTKRRCYIEHERCFETTQDKIDAIGYNSLFYVMNKLIHRQLIERNNLRFEEKVYYEDVAFMIRIFSLSRRMVTLPGINYMYVNHSVGITKGCKTHKKQTDYYHSHKALVKYCKDNNIRLDEKYKNITVRIWSFWGVTLLKLKEIENRRTLRLFDFIPICSYHANRG